MSDVLPSCFRGSADPETSTSTNSNLTTCFYQTALGVAALTWCRNIIGHALRIDLYFDYYDTEQTHINSTASFQLSLKPWFFWKKQGSKKFDLNTDGVKRRIDFFWDLSRAKFPSGPEPTSGFYVATVIDGEMLLLVGDSAYEAYARTRAKRALKVPALVMRREHVFGNRDYTTKAQFGGKTRDITVEYTTGSSGDRRLYFSIDKKRVLQVKRLKWKFRGNERIEFDGAAIQVYWDVYNWLFDDSDDAHAVFVFRFEKDAEEAENLVVGGNCKPKGMILWQPFGLGMKGSQKKKMKKSLLKTRSSSSSSSASSAGSSSVMEWASMEENELQSSAGFSLLIYAWRS